MKKDRQKKYNIQDNYNVLVFEKDVIERFRSDFKLVAKFFKNKRLNKKELNDTTEIRHVTEFVDFISAFTQDTRYKAAKEYLNDMRKKGERVSMCYVFDELCEMGENRMGKLISYLLANGMTEEVKEAIENREARKLMYEKYGIEVVS